MDKVRRKLKIATERPMMVRRAVLLVAMLAVMAVSAVAQTRDVRFSRQELSVKAALGEIQAQTGFGVIFNERRFETERTVRFSARQLSVDEAMTQITAGSGFTYSIDDGMITIAKALDLPQAEISTPSTPPARTSSETSSPLVPTAPPVTTVPIVPNTPAEDPKPQPPTPTIDPALRAETQQLLYDSFMDDYTSAQTYLPRFALRINLLYGAGTLTPNLAGAAALGGRSTLEFAGSYNPWNLKGNFESNRKLVHMILRADYRYWLCERYNGHFFSIGPMFIRYNAGGYNIPFLFRGELLFEKAHRYNGIAWGGGVGYGYQWMLGKRWGVEANIGVGVLLFDYDRYDCAVCDREPEPEKKVYYGITDAGVSIIYLIK